MANLIFESPLETPNALARYLHGEDIFAQCARFSSPESLQAAAHLLDLHIPHRDAKETACHRNPIT